MKDSANYAAQNLGYDSLKQHQMDVVLALAAGRDVFAVLPTGYGKSICYACLPVMFDRLDFIKSNHSIVAVVTPWTFHRCKQVTLP